MTFSKRKLSLLHRWMRDKYQARVAVSTAACICSSSSSTGLQPALTGKEIVPLQRRLLVTLLTAFFYFYPGLLTTTLSIFACYQLDYQPSNSVPYPLNARVGLCTACCGVFVLVHDSENQCTALQAVMLAHLTSQYSSSMLCFF